MLKKALLIEFNQQWQPMGISLGQSLPLSVLSVRFLSGLSSMFKLFVILFSCALSYF